MCNINFFFYLYLQKCKTHQNSVVPTSGRKYWLRLWLQCPLMKVLCVALFNFDVKCCAWWLLYLAVYYVYWKTVELSELLQHRFLWIIIVPVKMWLSTWLVSHCFKIASHVVFVTDFVWIHRNGYVPIYVSESRTYLNLSLIHISSELEVTCVMHFKWLKKKKSS